jgi:tetratricopeptide (TPR) repeat protein
MSKSLLEPMTFFSMIFLSVLIYLGFILRKRFWYISFGIFWFFISLISHILPPRANVIGEQKLYLTLTFMIPVIVLALSQLLPKKLIKVVLIFIIGAFFCLTFLRNLQWSDPVLIWKDTVAKSPHKARAYLNLGYSYAKKGQYDQALEAFLRAIQLDPYVPEAYINISQLYANKNNLDEAFSFANRGVEVAPDSPLTFVQRGIIFARQKKDMEALSDFSKSISFNSKDLEVYKMRGMIHVRLNKSQEALEDFKIWLEKHPQDVDVLSQRADIFFRDKKYQLALQDYDRLIKLTFFAPYYYNRSVLYEILGDHVRMQQDRQMAKTLGFK